jgi:hypothetical protein
MLRSRLGVAVVAFGLACLLGLAPMVWGSTEGPPYAPLPSHSVRAAERAAAERWVREMRAAAAASASASRSVPRPEDAPQR